MSKKSFTNGLDSLFSSSREERALQTLARPKRKDQAARAPEETLDKVPRKSAHQKTFALDIDAFLQEVLNESIREELEREQPRESSPSKTPKEHSGIDALIRSTLETSEMEINPGKTKRVTFFFDARKVEQLKEIAKHENIYMREVISRIVAEYLARQEKS